MKKLVLVWLVVASSLALAQAWEYAVLTVGGETIVWDTSGVSVEVEPGSFEGLEGATESLADILDYFGRQGWELVAVTVERAGETDLRHFYFKRQRP
jgi:hypothetical protein